MCYRDLSIHNNAFQTQTLEEPEPQDHIASEDLPHQHMFVVYLQNLYGEVGRQDHRLFSACTATGVNGLKKLTL